MCSFHLALEKCKVYWKIYFYKNMSHVYLYFKVFEFSFFHCLFFFILFKLNSVHLFRTGNGIGHKSHSAMFRKYVVNKRVTPFGNCFPSSVRDSNSPRLCHAFVFEMINSRMVRFMECKMKLIMFRDVWLNFLKHLTHSWDDSLMCTCAQKWFVCVSVCVQVEWKMLSQCTAHPYNSCGVL